MRPGSSKVQARPPTSQPGTKSKARDVKEKRHRHLRWFPANVPARGSSNLPPEFHDIAARFLQVPAELCSRDFPARFWRGSNNEEVPQGSGKDPATASARLQKGFSRFQQVPASNLPTRFPPCSSSSGVRARFHKGLSKVLPRSQQRSRKIPAGLRGSGKVPAAFRFPEHAC